MDAEDKNITLEEENRTLQKELDIVKGLLAKQDHEIESLRQKVTQMTACNMKDNILITG